MFQVESLGVLLPVIAAICNLQLSIPKHTLLLPAGHTTKSLGNSTMTHNRPRTSQKNNRAHGGKKHPFENNIFVSVFNFVYLFLYPHTTP